MKNLQSLMFNNVAGRFVYGASLYPKKKESIIKPITIKTYKFAVFCDYRWCRSGIYLCCERATSGGCHGWFSYGAGQVFAHGVANYYEKTYRCSLDCVLEMVPEGTHIEFEVKMAKDDFENEVLKDCIFESFIDKLLEGREADFAWSEYQEWLENEYCYV